MGDIMTIDMSRHLHENLLLQNSWPLFNGERGRRLLQSGKDIAVLCLTATGESGQSDMYTLQEQCAQNLSPLIFRNPHLSGLTAWAFPPTEWQTYNRVTAYRKLWKRYPHVVLPGAPKTAELEVRHEDQVLYFGGAQVYAANFSPAVSLLSDYSFLVLTSRILDETSLRHLYQAAFTDPPKNLACVVEWSELCLTLCQEGDLVIRKYVGKDGMEVILNLFMDQKHAAWFRGLTEPDSMQI